MRVPKNISYTLHLLNNTQSILNAFDNKQCAQKCIKWWKVLFKSVRLTPVSEAYEHSHQEVAKIQSNTD